MWGFRVNRGEVAVPVERNIADLIQLAEDEQDQLYKLYPRIDQTVGEGWFGVEVARQVISDYYRELLLAARF